MNALIKNITSSLQSAARDHSEIQLGDKAGSIAKRIAGNLSNVGIDFPGHFPQTIYLQIDGYDPNPEFATDWSIHPGDGKIRYERAE